MKRFRIIEAREKYITCDEVVNRPLFVIQEFTESWWGRVKWVDFEVETYGGWSRVEFYKLEKAQDYLIKLILYYTE